MTPLPATAQLPLDVTSGGRHSPPLIYSRQLFGNAFIANLNSHGTNHPASVSLLVFCVLVCAFVCICRGARYTFYLTPNPLICSDQLANARSLSFLFSRGFDDPVFSCMFVCSFVCVFFLSALVEERAAPGRTGWPRPHRGLFLTSLMAHFVPIRLFACSFVHSAAFAEERAASGRTGWPRPHRGLFLTSLMAHFVPIRLFVRSFEHSASFAEERAASGRNWWPRPHRGVFLTSLTTHFVPIRLFTCSFMHSSVFAEERSTPGRGWWPRPHRRVPAVDPGAGGAHRLYGRQRARPRYRAPKRPRGHDAGRAQTASIIRTRDLRTSAYDWRVMWPMNMNMNQYTSAYGWWNLFGGSSDVHVWWVVDVCIGLMEC